MHRNCAEEQQPGVRGGVPQEGHPAPRGRRGDAPQAADLAQKQFSVRSLEIHHRENRPVVHSTVLKGKIIRWIKTFRNFNVPVNE